MKRLHASLMAAVFLIIAGAALAQEPYKEGSMTPSQPTVSATDPQPNSTPQQPASSAPAPASSAMDPQSAKTDAPAAQTEPSTTPKSTKMPKTASPLPLMGLAGLLALAGGVLIRPRRTA